MPREPYRVGSRGSLLAQRQTSLVLKALKDAFPHNHRLNQAEVVWIKTSGDKIQDRPLAELGGKALFSKEIHQALLNEKIDFAVHSLKDLEHTSPAGLIIAAVLEREDCHDVLITPVKDNRGGFENLKLGGRIGTCAPRRAAQLLQGRPDLEIVPLRGNVPTRLQKLEDERLDGIVLALAGLKRLGIGQEGYSHLTFTILPFETMLPAAGQGALAIECREDDQELKGLLKEINHRETYACIQAERALLKALGGNCHTAIAAHAIVTTNKKLELTAAYFPDYPYQKRGRKLLTCQAGPFDEPIQLGQKAAAAFK